MGVSKYGIKVSTPDQYDVLHLYLIIREVCYDDGLGAGKSLLALKTTDASSEEVSLWVYQCSSLVRLRLRASLTRQTESKNQRLRDALHVSDPGTRAHVAGSPLSGPPAGDRVREQAQAICKVLSIAFDSVLTAEKV
ncbi:Integrin beta-1-binding protein 1 [Myotis davidii]|uniref:Integrin beta-1-binding protein 1 n=1 Tax=Myotis davidii TaxID=225400 RepID=L5MEZ1_MYODS|nr:Integrin beta-1-binding protein 1 [Myotis davidii]